jgi:hypothetical protein
MAKFKKRIVLAGMYEIPQPDGSYRREFIDPERLEHWADTARTMLQRGFRIPAPWNHDGAALPVQVGVDGTLSSALDNGGWWTGFTVEEELDGTPALYGVLEIPGEIADPHSLASKIGQTIKDTSVYVRPEFRDSSGQAWTDALMHVALVTHPIEHNQPNFTPLDTATGQRSATDPGLLPAGSLALCMNYCRYPVRMALPAATGSVSSRKTGGAGGPGMPGTPGKGKSPAASSADKSLQSSLGQEGGDAQINSFQELLLRLREVAKIALPEDTSPENLIERLRVALLQKAASEEEEDQGSITTPPEGATEQPAPVLMSFNPKQIASILASKVVNPDTGQPFTEAELKAVGSTPAPAPVTPPADEVVMSHPRYQELEKSAGFLAARLNEQALAGLRTRIKGLISGPKAKITQEYAQKHLEPHLAGFKMSFNADGTVRPHQVEVILDALEAVPTVLGPSRLLPGTAMSLPAAPQGVGAAVEPLPPGFEGSQVSEQQAAEIANEFLKNTV